MRQEFEEEYALFLDDMKREETFCRYMDEDEYEDEYSHNEIEEYQQKFIEKAKEWLRENRPGKYIITSGWCVFVMTIEEANKRKLINYKVVV